MNLEKDENEVEKLDLIYLYTKDFIDNRKREIEGIHGRLIVLLTFGSFLFLFGTELSDDRPEYILTKIMTLFVSFHSISIVLSALGCSPKTIIVRPSFLVENEYFQKSSTEIKLAIVKARIETSKTFELLTNEKQDAIKRAARFLVSSTLFFTLNFLLVTWFGK